MSEMCLSVETLLYLGRRFAEGDIEANDIPVQELGYAILDMLSTLDGEQTLPLDHYFGAKSDFELKYLLKRPLLSKEEKDADR